MESVNLVSYEKEREFREKISLSREYVIVGCGGVGWWVAIFLAMLGAPKLLLIDGDKIEATNLNRLSCPQTWLGQSKAVALRKIIHFLRPFCGINVFTSNIREADFELLNSLISSGATIIDATDDARIQLKLYHAFSINGHEYIKVGYEGFKVGSYSDMHSWLTDDYTPGYRTTSANVVSSALAAGIGLFNLFLERKDLEVDIINLIKNGVAVK